MTSYLVSRTLPQTVPHAPAEDSAPRLLLERLAHLRPDPPRLLNADCGDGNLLRWALRWFAGTAMTGTDPRPECLYRAVDNARHARFLRGSSLALPLPDRSFDIAVMLAPALPDRATWSSQLRELRRVVADGGLIGLAGPVVSVPSDWLHQLGLTVVDMRYRPESGHAAALTVLVLRAYRPEIRSA